MPSPGAATSCCPTPASASAAPTARSPWTTPTGTAGQRRRWSPTSAAAGGPTTAAASPTCGGTRSRTTAGRRRHDPRVGMVGGSYGGQVQFAVAGIDPRVDTIVPIITWNDLSYSLAPNNTELHHPGRPGRALRHAGHREGRLDLACSSASASPTASSTPRPTRSATSAARTSPTGPAPPRRRWTRWATRPRTPSTSPGTPACRRTSTGSASPPCWCRARTTRCSTCRRRSATYRALRAQGTPVKMIWQSWGHSGGGAPAPGELDMAHPRASYEGRRIATGSTTTSRTAASAPDRGFAYFRDWVDVRRSRDARLRHVGGLPGRRDPGPLPLRLATRWSRPRRRCCRAARPTPTSPARSRRATARSRRCRVRRCRTT